MKEAAVTKLLTYRPPFAWETLLNFLRGRAVPAVEQVEASLYRRTVSIDQQGKTYRGWISVSNRPEWNRLEVTLSSSLLPVLNQVLARLRFLFDLNCRPEEIEKKLGNMHIGKRRVFEPGLRLICSFDGFEITVRAILGQQITVRAAQTLAMRVATRLGKYIQTPFKGLTVTFPTIERICDLELPVEEHFGPLGIIGARARSIRAVAEALKQGAIRLGPDADPKRAVESLGALPGFGPWTVQYVAMRTLDWKDAFPHTDYGVKRALGNQPPKELLALSQEWSPWRSYATMCLWNYLANTKNLH